MARTVVFIFLLETLPEFPLVLNHTLQETFSKMSADLNYTLQDCNTNIANSVLQKANLEMSRNNSNWKLLKINEDPIEEYTKIHLDSVYNEDTVFDNAIPDSAENSFENVQDYDQNVLDNYGILQKFHKKVNNKFTKPKSIAPESPPFLVAIFETRSNVTAQTCAGSLLSAHWVVTAASCVGVLSEFYRNSTNSTEKSRYTVVAGSTNPLIDGSIYNVTDIIVQPLPVNKAQPNNFSKVDSFANLAMMKVSPGLAFQKINILKDKEDFASGFNATVYGWTIAKDEFGQDAMLPTSISAKKTSSSLCQPKNSKSNSSSILCFNPELTASTNSTKLGVGGPVLAHNQMLGVVLDDRVPLRVEPLAAHAWIQALINTDSL